MKWFYDLRLRTKLLAVFAFIGAIAAVSGLIGYASTSQLSDVATQTLSRQTTLLISLREITRSFQEMHTNLSSSLLSSTETQRATCFDKTFANERALKGELEALKELIKGREQEAVYESLARDIGQFGRDRDSFIELVKENKLEEARLVLMDGIVRPAVVEQSIQRLSEMSSRDARAQLAASGKAASNVKVLFITVLLAGGGLAVALGLFVARTVDKPLTAIVETIDNADLNTEFRSDRKDEIGDLVQSFDRFVATIKSTLLRVVEATAAVASASAEISASTEEMAAGAQQQSTQATEVASAVEEMSKTTLENSRNAAATAETARSARQVAEQGGRVVSDGLAGMKRVAEVVQQSAESVRALGKSSDQIGQIIAVIDDIADQTNLLALNAAIEAARAGEQGRGFAVVADEVRKLAERTTKATKEIADMIRKIQTDTNQAVGSMQQGTKEVEQAVRFADEAAGSLKAIVEISQRVGDMVAQIAAASEEQAGAGEDIAKSVESISHVTRETASGIQQIARTTEDLSRLTESLQGLISRFKLSSESLPEMHAARAIPAQHGTGYTGFFDSGRSGKIAAREQKATLAVPEDESLVQHLTSSG